MLRARFEKAMTDNTKPQNSRTRPLTGVYADAQMHGTGAKMRPASGIILPLSSRVVSGDYSNQIENVDTGYYDDGYNQPEWNGDEDNKSFRISTIPPSSNKSNSMKTLPVNNSATNVDDNRNTVMDDNRNTNTSIVNSIRPDSFRSANSNVSYSSEQSGRLSIYSKSTMLNDNN